MKMTPDLNPTPEARLAISLFPEMYARQNKGSMGFFETSLSGSDRQYVRYTLRAVALAAKDHKITLDELAR